MTLLSYQALSDLLPAGAVEFVGANQVKANFSQVTGDEINLDSSCIEGVAKLMDKLAELTTSINETRYGNGENPIDFVRKDRGFNDGDYTYTLTIKVDPSTRLDNLLDPTE